PDARTQYVSPSVGGVGPDPRHRVFRMARTAHLPAPARNLAPGRMGDKQQCTASAARGIARTVLELFATLLSPPRSHGSDTPAESSDALILQGGSAEDIALDIRPLDLDASHPCHPHLASREPRRHRHEHPVEAVHETHP